MGAFGVVAGTILSKVVFAELAVPFAVVSATTLMLYATPFVRPVNV
jgi:ABC-type phosphate transport system permease subunit